MIRERWTVLFLRGEANAVRQYSLPLRAVRPVLVCAGILAALVLSATAFLFYDSGARVRAGLLARENQLLERELGDLRARVGDFETRIADLAEQDRQTRIQAGRVGIDADVFDVGVGGPGLATPGEGELWSLDPEASELAYATLYDIEVLERRADLLEESFPVTASMFEEQRDRAEAMPTIFPVGGPLSSRFSRSRFHPVHQEYRPHEGIDISAITGTPIIAAGSGVVTFAGRKQGYGLMVEIDHGWGVISRYAHASRLLVYQGKRVQRKEVIAQVGSTGTSMAPHLHFEIHENGQAVDPLNYMQPNAGARVPRR